MTEVTARADANKGDMVSIADGLVGDLVSTLVGFGGLGLLNFSEFAVNEIALDDVLGNVGHEFGVCIVPRMEYFGSPHDIFTIESSTNVCYLVGLIITDFINQAVGVVLDLFISDVVLYF